MELTPEIITKLLAVQTRPIRVHQLVAEHHPIGPVPLEIGLSDGDAMQMSLWITTEPRAEAYEGAAARLIKTAIAILELGAKMHPANK